MISFGYDLTKGSRVNTTCIYTFIKYMHPFYTLHLSLSLMTMSVLQKVFVRKIDFLRVSLNQYLNMFWCFYIISYLCKSFIYCLKKEDVSKKCVDFDFISLFILMFYIHIALCYQEFYLQDACNNFGRATFCIVETSFSYISIDC